MDNFSLDALAVYIKTHLLLAVVLTILVVLFFFSLRKKRRGPVRAKADLGEARDRLRKLQAEHKHTTARLDKERQKHTSTTSAFNKLKKEQERTTTALAEAGVQYDKLHAEHGDLDQKYELVSNLLNAKHSENEEFEKFKKIFNEEFMAFANKESSLADEASAVQKLQRLEKKLEEIVAFPHMFTKKSIAIGGGFSSGKSEFINSFIKHPDIKLPVGIKPVTAIPSFVISNPNPEKVSIKGFSNKGATVDIELEFYCQLSRDFIDTFPFDLKDIMPYMAVEVPLKEGSFENIYLIDTPGYDSAGGNASEDRTTATDFLNDRDALIWMIPAKTGTIPKEDLKFIEDMELNGLPFYMVLSKADVPSESQLEEILDEVKEALDDEGIEYVGISAYSATLRKEYLYDGMSLDNFFVSQNKPVRNPGDDLKKEIEEVFERYEKAIKKDEKTADWLVEKLNSLNLDMSNLGSNTPSQDLTYKCRCGKSFYIPNLQRKVMKVKKEVMAGYQCFGCRQNLDLRRLNSNDLDPDNIDDLTEKIDKIIESQSKDFTEIKKEMRQVKKNMLKAVDNVFWSLTQQSTEASSRPNPQPPPDSRDISSHSSTINPVQERRLKEEVKRKREGAAGLRLPSVLQERINNDVAQTENLVNINRATARELARIPSISSQIAERVVAYRKQNGAFQRIDDLAKVKGIGPKVMERFKEYVTC